MRKTYLILDLRNYTYVPGLLTIEDKEVSWYTTPIFQVIKDWDTSVRDPASVVPLSFRRRHKSRTWSPIQLEPQALDGIDESKFEFIPFLFDESPDRLETLLPGTLGPLLRDTFNEYGAVSDCWMLVDNAEVRDVMESRFEKFIRSKRIEISVPGDWGALGGFVLAFHGLDDAHLPRDGTSWLCNVADVSTRYRWKDAQFVVERVDGVSALTGGSPSSWGSSEELERAGAALLVIFWQDRLMRIVDHQIETLEGQLERDRYLLNRLRDVYERLSPEKLVLGRHLA